MKREGRGSLGLELTNLLGIHAKSSLRIKVASHSVRGFVENLPGSSLPRSAWVFFRIFYIWQPAQGRR